MTIVYARKTRASLREQLGVGHAGDASIFELVHLLEHIRILPIALWVIGPRFLSSDRNIR